MPQLFWGLLVLTPLVKSMVLCHSHTCFCPGKV